MGLASAAGEAAQLAVRISLEDLLSPGLKKISGNLGKFEHSNKRIAKGVGQLSGGLLKAGVIAGGAAATGLAFAAKTAIEFDDAFASVRKTVSASEPELNALNDQLHALATRIPVKYTDLADIAAEAGALGVPTKSVAKFTETVARLTASTQGLTVEGASEAFGKFRNILHLADSDLTRAASSLIALGNAGASSEGDIIEVAKRFGAAGHQAGLSAAQVLGFSSAIASLGVEPEAAGSSLSRIFNNITKYIGTGDKKIVAFAKTSKLSVKEFSKFFAKDATGAVELFLDSLKGLDRFQASKVLKEAGITNVRDINAILLMSQNVGELKRQINLSSDAFKKNTELQDVSTKRFDTLKNKLIQLKNGFLEAGYNISVGFLPALGRVVDKLSKFLALPSTKSTLKGIGEDIGKALDNIDFDKLFTAVKGFAQLLDPALKTLLKIVDLIAKLPPELVGAGAGLIITNKVTGGALSSGLGNIFGGLGESLARSLATKIPVFGKAFVQPVFVTNLGPGGLGGPGGGGTPGGPGVLSTISVVLAAGAVAELGYQISEGLKQPLTDAFKTAFPNVKQGGVDTFTQSLNQLQSTFLPGFDALNHLSDVHLDQLPVELGRIADFITGNHPVGAPSNARPVGEHSRPDAQSKTPRPSGEHAAAAAVTSLHHAAIPAINAIKGSTDKGAAVGEQAKHSIQLLKDSLSAIGKTDTATTKAALDGVKAKQAASIVAFRAGERAQLTGNSLASTANERLNAIRRKRTQFTVHNTVNVSTRVSVSDMTKAQAYRARVSRTTSLSAGDSGYNNAGK